MSVRRAGLQPARSNPAGCKPALPHPLNMEPKTAVGKKKDLYAWLGMREYFVFDPEYKLQPPLRAFRLHGANLMEEIVLGNRVLSAESGLELVNDGLTLRLYNPRTKEFLLTPAESYARADRLAAKLRELGLDPDQL